MIVYTKGEFHPQTIAVVDCIHTAKVVPDDQTVINGRLFFLIADNADLGVIGKVLFR